MPGQVKVHGFGFVTKPINPVDTILEFIVNTYPVKEYSKVLEIAAGNGNFSQLLSNCGYQVTAMDPKLTIDSKANYQLMIDRFKETTDISQYDLGIAIHPCGIHKEIIRNFKINEKALFLIPCCTFSCEDKELIGYHDNQSWLNYLMTLNPNMKKKVFFDSNHNHLLVKSFSNCFYIDSSKNK